MDIYEDTQIYNGATISGYPSRFFCIVGREEHSKYLSTYELYKYHLLHCRELRDSIQQDFYICKFCVRIFLDIQGRDQHQGHCTCRLVPENSVFEMPVDLRQSYLSNRIGFANFEDVKTIIEAFPTVEPLSLQSYRQGGQMSESEDQDRSLSRIESDRGQQRETSCCKRDLDDELDQHQSVLEELDEIEEMIRNTQLDQQSTQEKKESKDIQSSSEEMIIEEPLSSQRELDVNAGACSTRAVVIEEDDSDIAWEEGLSITQKISSEDMFQTQKFTASTLPFSFSEPSHALKNKSTRGCFKNQLSLNQLQSPPEESGQTGKSLTDPIDVEEFSIESPDLIAVNIPVAEEDHCLDVEEILCLRKQNDPTVSVDRQEVVKITIVELMQRTVVALKSNRKGNFEGLSRIQFKQIDTSSIVWKPLNFLGQLQPADTSSADYLRNRMHLNSCFIRHDFPSLNDYFSGNTCVFKEVSKGFVLCHPKQSPPLFEVNGRSIEGSDERDDIKVAVDVFEIEGVSVWSRQRQMKIIHLVNTITKEWLEELAASSGMFEKTDEYNLSVSAVRQLEKLSSQKEEMMGRLVILREKLAETKQKKEESSKHRQSQLKQIEEAIAAKQTECHVNTQQYSKKYEEIKGLLQSVGKLQEALKTEIDLTFAKAKEKSDDSYNLQLAKHKSDIVELAQENIQDKFLLIEEGRRKQSENETALHEAYSQQRKASQQLLKITSRIDELQNAKKHRQKSLQPLKDKDSTAYLCLVCKKYPQNCLQKPCGHIVCCYHCIHLENEQKAVIFCRLCKTEIIKFQEIKYKPI